MTNSYLPWFFNQLKKHDTKVNKNVVLAISALMATLLLSIIAFAPEIINIMAGNKYAEAAWVVPPVSMSVLFLLYTSFFTNIEFFFEEKKYLVFGSILSAVLNVILNYIFISIFGYIAAAYTTLLSFIIFAICNYYYTKVIYMKHNIEFDMFSEKKMLVLSLMFCATGFGMMSLYKYSIIRYMVISIIGVLFLFNYKKLLSCFKKYIAMFK